VKSGRELKLSTCEKDEKVNIKIPKDIRDVKVFFLFHLYFSGQIMYSPEMEISLH